MLYAVLNGPKGELAWKWRSQNWLRGKINLKEILDDFPYNNFHSLWRIIIYINHYTDFYFSHQRQKCWLFIFFYFFCKRTTYHIKYFKLSVICINQTIIWNSLDIARQYKSSAQLLTRIIMNSHVIMNGRSLLRISSKIGHIYITHVGLSQLWEELKICYPHTESLGQGLPIYNLSNVSHSSRLTLN